MQAIIPKSSTALSILLRSDLITQWRNRRSVILILLIPVIILISWKGMVEKSGGNFVLSTCITIGLTAIGLMGYANSLARDRDKGIFQRLRVAPIPNWTIMISRLTVQLAMILLLTLLVYFVGYKEDKILLHTDGYILCFLATLIGGAMYLGLGQMIAGLLKNAETVNATTRLVYFVFIMVGMFGELGALGDQLRQVVHWSPYGVVRTIISSGMTPSSWNSDASISLAATFGYAMAFSILGIKKFRWNTK